MLGRFLPKTQRRDPEAGGVGFATGDGRLQSRAGVGDGTPKYDARVAPGLNVALNYQTVANAAYNADWGAGERLRAPHPRRLLREGPDVPSKTDAARGGTTDGPRPARQPEGIR